jgi:pimeloyl-ACP methyl ester carboxylesterase
MTTVRERIVRTDGSEIYSEALSQGTITMPDGRTVGFADYGTPGQTAVLWCHGGPGCRFEPEFVAAEAARAGLRLIGIDRPGYGQATPWPGRTIGGWVPDGLAVADHLDIERFVTVGVSTGGAYALALAACSDRVLGTVACCAVSDMRWAEGKAMNVACHPVWNAPDRAAALATVAALFGEDGSRMVPNGPEMAAADRAMFDVPDDLRRWNDMVPEMFVHGVAGFADDRLADGHGWHDFDVAAIACPVVVLHGTSDTLMPVANAHHTASLIPGARLRICDGHGHMSILREVVGTVCQLLDRNLS